MLISGSVLPNIYFMSILIAPLKAMLGGGFKYFLFSPLFGEDSNIFQMG